MPLIALLLYLFTLFATLFFLGYLPAAVVSLILHYRRTHAIVAAAILTGFLIGGLGAWMFVPSEWKLPLWETFYAGFRSDIYGHPVEHQAENIAFMLLFFADLGAIATGLAAWRRLRPCGAG